MESSVEEIGNETESDITWHEVVKKKGRLVSRVNRSDRRGVTVTKPVSGHEKKDVDADTLAETDPALIKGDTADEVHKKCDGEIKLATEESLSFSDVCLEKRILLEGLIAEAVISRGTCQLFSDNNQAIMRLHALGDVHTVVSVMREWSRSLQKNNHKLDNWAKTNGVNLSELKAIEERVEQLYKDLKSTHRDVPALNFRANLSLSDKLLLDALCESYGQHLMLYRGHPSLGYLYIRNGSACESFESQTLKNCWKMPEFIIRFGLNSPAFAAIPVSKAETICKDTFGISLDEIRKNAVVRFEVPNVGMVTRKRVMEKFNCNAKPGGIHPSILDYSEDSHGLVCFAPQDKHEQISSFIQELIGDVRREMNDSELELRYPNDFSNFRVELGPGAITKNTLFDGEFSRLAAKLRTDSKLTPEKAMSVLTAQQNIKSVTQETSKSTELVLEMHLQKPASIDTLSEFEKLCQDFELERLPPENTTPPELVSERYDVDFEVEWQVHTNRYYKKKVTGEHLKMVESRLLRILQDYDREDTQITHLAQSQTNKGNVVCTVRTTDRQVSHRLFQTIEEVEQNNKLFRIINKCQIRKQLTGNSFQIDTRVYKAVKTVLEAKLQNFSTTLKTAFTWNIQELPEYVNLEFNIDEGDLQTLQRITNKILICLQPTAKTFKTSEIFYLQHPRGNLLLDILMDKTKTFLYVPDFRKQLHIYGSRKASKTASEMLKEHFKKSQEEKIDWHSLKRSDKHPFNLNTKLIQTIKIRGKEIFNDDLQDIAFQDSGDIVYYASKNGAAKFEQLLKDITLPGSASSSAEVAAKPECDQNEKTCVSCYVDVDMSGGQWSDQVYIMEGCGHIYCCACLRMQLRDALASGTLPLRCAGCDSLISLQDVMTACSKMHCGNIRDVITMSLRAFVSNPENEHRPCPRVNCIGLYRTDSNKTPISSCGICVQRLCLKCLERYHGKMSCENFAQSKFSVELWMSENPYKRKQCPHCRMGIEKESGCNNVLCTFCRKNVCWKCLKWFNSAQDCYSHLDKFHQGYY